jgi:hypothetical protein
MLVCVESGVRNACKFLFLTHTHTRIIEFDFEFDFYNFPISRLLQIQIMFGVLTHSPVFVVLLLILSLLLIEFNTGAVSVAVSMNSRLGCMAGFVVKKSE